MKREMKTKRTGDGRKKETRENPEFDQKIIDLARITRVMAGGKRMRFRAAVVIGNHNGEVGFGLAKAADVSMAISKAAKKAHKNLISISLTKYKSIAHEVRYKDGAAKILLKPAVEGHGIKAGGAVRIVLELAGVNNITAKMLGSNNKINNSRATLAALQTVKQIKNK